MRVLVAYASAHGSTAGVAEGLAHRLAERGLDVDVRRVADVTDTKGYDALVLGSAAHGRRWLTEADQFAQAKAQRLVGRPVWLFTVGVPGALAPRLRGWAAREGPLAIAPYQGLRPLGTRLFSGVVSKKDFPFTGRLVFRLMGGRYGDFRDWSDIDAWADGIADALAERDAHPPARRLGGE
jgi:menaquinone-dependent protoporphyrinogen oxidase